MAEVFGSESQRLLVRARGIAPTRSRGLLLVLGASLLFPAVFVSAQSTSSPQRKAPKNASNPAATEPAGPPPGEIWLPPVQAAQHAPVIAWDGKLLTIDAENSSLSDILLAIRSHTGASIEMPASTNRERIAIHLGPAPVREVLASLLYGTSFNYVIQSSEDDVTALGKVIITASDGDLSDDTVVADTDSNPSNLSNPSNASNPSNPKRRMMPGYAAPGKRDFEVSMSSATDDSSSNLAEAPAAEPSAPASDQPSTAAATDSNATSAQPDGRPVPSTADANDSSSSSDSPAVVAAGPSGSAAGTIAGNSSSGGSSEATPAVSQMEQQLQNMYQKRQQLQAQQNRAAQTPAQ